MRYISAKEAGVKWSLSDRRVRGLCQEGRVDGAVRSGRDWLIPADAPKPLKGKASKLETDAERLDLYLNPTFCNNCRASATSDEERAICQATDLFLQGRFEDARQILAQLVARGPNDSYLLVAYMTLYLIYSCSESDVSKSDSVMAEIDTIIARNPHFVYTHAVVSCVRGERPRAADLINLPNSFEPIFAESFCYLGVMDDLAGRRQADPSCLEMLARTIDEREQPACALYAHIALALYSNLSHDQKLYGYHVRKSLEIALPRGWYAPLANYSYALDWKQARETDPAAYREIQKISAIILGTYIKTGRFGKAHSSIAAMDTNEFKVAFMSTRGISVKDISLALGISTYKVRKTLKNVYDHTATMSRSGLREALNNQFKAV